MKGTQRTIMRCLKRDIARVGYNTLRVDLADLSRRQAGGPPRSSVAAPASESLPNALDISKDVPTSQADRDAGRAICGQGARLSHAAAARSTEASSNRRPVICRPTGNPSSSTPHGTEIAGWPVRFAG